MAIIKQFSKNRIFYFTLISIGVVVSIATLLAQAPQPVLKISHLGSNQFSVLITNGVSTTNYTLYWTPVLEDELYPWSVLRTNAVGGTNFMVNMGESQTAFFRVLLGTDADGDMVPEWLDAQPLNPAVGILSITIDSPLNGSQLQ